MLFLGGSGLVYEYCISTLATHLLGNSIEQFSVIIALMLFAMGIAGLAQRAIKDAASVPEIFVLVEIALGFVGGASAILLYLAFAYLDHFYLALYGLALLIGFGIGLEIPLLLRINQAWRDDLSQNVGDIFSLDYIGALIGALIWAYVLLPAVSLDQISLMLGLVNMGAAALTMIAFWPDLKHRGRVIIALLAATAGLIALSAWGPTLIDDARQRLYADPIRAHITSPYQDLVITGTGARFSLYLNGHLQFDSEDEFIYHEMLVHPAVMAADAPRRALVLGGGDGLAVRELLKWPQLESILLVDLDPAVTDLARTFPPLVALNEGALNDRRVSIRHPKLPDSGEDPPARVPVYKAGENVRDALDGHRAIIAEVQVLHMDADLFLRVTPDTYDVIIADFPDPSSPDLAKLFSLELYHQLKRRLAPGGVMAVQAGSPYTTRRAFWAVRDTLEAAGLKAISMHAHVPNFGEWGWHIARAEMPPAPAGTPPFPTRYLDAATLQAAQVFPAPLARPDAPAVSTRLDPRVLMLYTRGEPLVGPTLFPGSAHR
ncbi:MAG: spermidine synthase [Bradymonadia bacterium]